MSDRKRDDTKSDRPSALPSITAPRFQKGGAPTPEVSVTSPVTAPELEAEERTRTETQLDPSAYAPPPDKDPDELGAEFQPASGKELDARGRLVRQELPEPGPAPEGTDDLPRTEVAIPEMRPPKKPAPRHALERVEAAPPAPPGPPVVAQRREPGRWILDREGHVSKESPDFVEPGAFDPTVRKAVPPEPERPRRVPRKAIAAGVAAVLLLVAGAAVWTLRPGQGQGATTPTTEAPASSTPEVLRIKVTSRPSGATVKINGLPFGTTPVDRESPFAPEAELEVEVTLKGHRPWTRRFQAGQSVSAHAALKQAR